MASNGPSHNEANDFMKVNSNFYKSIVPSNIWDTLIIESYNFFETNNPHCYFRIF